MNTRKTKKSKRRRPNAYKRIQKAMIRNEKEVRFRIRQFGRMQGFLLPDAWRNALLRMEQRREVKYNPDRGYVLTAKGKRLDKTTVRINVSAFNPRTDWGV